jgi:hypothetical protein
LRFILGFVICDLFGICHLLFEICPDAFVGTASSVGLEHYFDRVGVTGSNPVQSTRLRLELGTSAGFVILVKVGCGKRCG